MNQVSDIVAETDALIDGWRARAMGIVVGALITFMPPWIGAEEAGEPARELKQVLILESFGRDFALWNAVPPTLKQELAQQLPWPIEFHEAALETARADQPQAEAAFAEYLRALYAGHRPDLVVPVGRRRRSFCGGIEPGCFPRRRSSSAGLINGCCRCCRSPRTTPRSLRNSTWQRASRTCGSCSRQRPTSRW